MKLIDWFYKTIMPKRQAYRATFNIENPNDRIVLSDLRKFCKATITPVVVSPGDQHIDVNASLILIGRLEVWHHICQHLHLADDDLYKLVEQQTQQQLDGTE